MLLLHFYVPFVSCSSIISTKNSDYIFIIFIIVSFLKFIHCNPNHKHYQTWRIISDQILISHLKDRLRKRFQISLIHFFPESTELSGSWALFTMHPERTPIQKRRRHFSQFSGSSNHSTLGYWVDKRLLLTFYM